MQIQDDGIEGKEIIILKTESRWLTETEQRELLLWFKNNRPMMWREIFCDDCPEVH